MSSFSNFMKKNWDIILGLISLLYFVCLIFLSKLFFKYIFLAISILLIIYHFVKEKLKKLKIFKFLRIGFILFLAVFIIIESMILFYPKKNTDKCDYIIVLGALVNKNEISKTLKDRLDAAIDYLNKSDDEVYIVVSGGQGRGENISEAEAMNNYLVQNNVDENIIIQENKSTTTEENFKYSKKIIENHSGKNIDEVEVKVVTTDFHSFRSSLMARNNDFKNYSFYTSKTKYYLAPLNYVREFFATIYYIFIH